MERVEDDRSNPMNLMEKILQTRIFRNSYWKEQCFGLTEETLVERAMELKYIGGTFGGNKTPTPFICLILAMLHMRPEQEIILQLIQNEDYKYVTALGAFYLRMTAPAVDVYQYLEPLLMDWRKLRKRTDSGFMHVYMDKFIEELLSPDNYCCDISLPFLMRRKVLEDNEELKPRCSTLNDSEELAKAIEAVTGKKDESEDSDELEASFKERMKRERWRDKKMKRNTSRSPSRSRSPDRRRSRSHRDYKDRRYSRSRSRSRDRRTRRYERESSRERQYRRRSRSPSFRPRDRSRSRDRKRRRYSRSRSPRRRRDSYSRRDRDRRSRSPPPKRHKSDKNPTNKAQPKKESKGKNGEISLSIEETNRVRAELGLPPLK